MYQNSEILSPIAVDAVLAIIDPLTATNVDLNDIRIVKQIGGTIDDTELVHGLVFDKVRSARALHDTAPAKAPPAPPRFAARGPAGPLPFHSMGV